MEPQRCQARHRAFFNGHGIQGRTCNKSLQVINPDGGLTTVALWDAESNGVICWTCGRQGPMREDYLMRWEWLLDSTPIYDDRDFPEVQERVSREQELFRHALSRGKIVKTGFAPGSYESDW